MPSVLLALRARALALLPTSTAQASLQQAFGLFAATVTFLSACNTSSWLLLNWVKKSTGWTWTHW
jgi:hypothetical protein